jgi:hypothetical protein
MAITPFPDPAPADAAGAVASACAGIDGVAEVLWSARGDEELVAGVEELQQLKAKAVALQASLLAEIDARGIPWKQLTSGSPWTSRTEGGPGHR